MGGVRIRGPFREAPIIHGQGKTEHLSYRTHYHCFQAEQDTVQSRWLDFQKVKFFSIPPLALLQLLEAPAAFCFQQLLLCHLPSTTEIV